MTRLPVTLLAALLALPVQSHGPSRKLVQFHPAGTEFITPDPTAREVSCFRDARALADRTVMSIQYTGSQDHPTTPILIGLSARDVAARRYDPSSDYGIVIATGVVVSAARMDALLGVVGNFKGQVVSSGDRYRFGDLTVTVYAPRHRQDTLLFDRAASLRLLARLKQVSDGFAGLQAALDEQVYSVVHDH